MNTKKVLKATVAWEKGRDPEEWQPDYFLVRRGEIVDLEDPPIWNVEGHRVSSWNRRGLFLVFSAVVGGLVVVAVVCVIRRRRRKRGESRDMFHPSV